MDINIFFSVLMCYNMPFANEISTKIVLVLFIYSNNNI